MSSSPEGPKMAQGRKAGPRPEDTLEEKLRKSLRLQRKKLKEIIDRFEKEN